MRATRGAVGRKNGWSMVDRLTGGKGEVTNLPGDNCRHSINDLVAKGNDFSTTGEGLRFDQTSEERRGTTTEKAWMMKGKDRKMN